MEIAVRHGWHTGGRSDDTLYPIHRPLFFLDTHWTEYDWAAHLSVARAERPALTSVPDLLTTGQLPAALTMAEELAPYTDAILIIPKCDVIESLPRCIGGTPVVLGYSVPTTYGGTNLPIWAFQGWPVHLLGGTPKRQVALAHYLNVVSADGNMCLKLSKRGIAFDERGRGLQGLEPMTGLPGMPARVLERSLTNIPLYWQRSGFQLEPREVA